MKYTFGDIVVVEGENIGVVVKFWLASEGKVDGEVSYDVYVRMYNNISTYQESEIERYLVRHKYLSDEEKQYQHNAVHDL